MDDRTFRQAMGKFATGVTVITTQVEDEVHGMTANAFVSVSLNPKLVLVSVDEKAIMHQRIEQSGRFAVSVLSEEQRYVSMHFAGQKEATIGIEIEPFHDLPIIKDSLANIVCTVYSTHKAGDHTLYIGEVVDINVKDGSPLAFYEGKYGKIIS